MNSNISKAIFFSSLDLFQCFIMSGFLYSNIFNTSFNNNDYLHYIFLYSSLCVFVKTIHKQLDP